MKKLLSSYDDIISVENLLGAWQEFVRGKRGKEGCASIWQEFDGRDCRTAPRSFVTDLPPRRRMMRRIVAHPTETTLQSHYGLLAHGNAWKLTNNVRTLSWLSKSFVG